MLDVNTIKAKMEQLNNEAQQLNAERQRMLGAKEVAEKKYAQLLEQYNSTYNTNVTDVQQELQRVLVESEKAVTNMERQIEYIRSGAYKTETTTSEKEVAPVNTAPVNVASVNTASVNVAPVNAAENTVPILDFSQLLNNSTIEVPNVQNTNASAVEVDADTEEIVGTGFTPNAWGAGAPVNNAQEVNVSSVQEVNNAFAGLFNGAAFNPMNLGG